MPPGEEGGGEAVAPLSEAEERGLQPSHRQRMRELASAYAATLPSRDTGTLARGLDARLVYTDLGARDGAFDPEHGVILIDRKASPQRQRFTLAHEVSHALLLHDDDLLSSLHDVFEGERLESAIETLCNVGAAAILLPPDLQDEVLLRYGPSGRALAELSRRADVSASSAMYALAERSAGAVLYALCSRVGGRRLEEGVSGRQRRAQTGAQRPVVVRASAETAGARYSLRPGTPIPEDHPVVLALDTGLEQGGRSYVPFRSGRKMPAWVDAYPDGQRVMVSFRTEEKGVGEKGAGEQKAP